MSYLKHKPGSIEELAKSMAPKLEADYQDKFKKELDKSGHKGIGTMSPKEKKDFFNKMDKMHKAKNEDHMADKKNAELRKSKGEMKEGAMKGMLMDLEDDAAEMSLQAFLSKHKGGMTDEDTLKAIHKKVNESVNEDQNDNPANFQHLCAKQVTHESHGQGETVYSMHAEPDEEGNIAWYDVMFEHGIEKGVPIEELKVITSSSHNSHYKMKGKKKSLKATHCSEVEPKGKEVNELTAGQKKLPPALQKAIKDKEKKEEKDHSYKSIEESILDVWNSAAGEHLKRQEDAKWLKDEPLEEGEKKKIAEETKKCPRCGAMNETPFDKCHNCGLPHDKFATYKKEDKHSKKKAMTGTPATKVDTEPEAEFDIK
tara:strand:- start:439 stop:1548 length:1110 start_codon:yes stop_codon:yes gene_type:complete